MQIPLMHELDKVLNADASAVADRLRHKFDETAGPATSIVLFGAGALGRKMLNELREIGVQPLAFVDNQAVLYGSLRRLTGGA